MSANHLKQCKNFLIIESIVDRKRRCVLVDTHKLTAQCDRSKEKVTDSWAVVTTVACFV